MSPHPTCDAARDWLDIQQAIGDLLRLSMEQAAQEETPGTMALLLMRLAYAEVAHAAATEEIGESCVEVEVAAVLGAA